MDLKEIDFENYGKCVQLSNGVIDLVVTIDCGPRIVRFGFIGNENILYNDLDRKFKVQNEFMDDYYSEGAACYFYGGRGSPQNGCRNPTFQTTTPSSTPCFPTV